MRIVRYSGICQKVEDKMRKQSTTEGEITVQAEDEEEFNQIMSALRGAVWLRKDSEGKLDVRPAYPEPGPVEDPVQLDLHWGKNLGPPSYFKQDFEGHRKQDPSIFVQGISGYGDYYAENAKKLEEAGFEVLRSRRGPKGQYWEIWYLPGQWAAKGPIEGKSIDDIVHWLCQLSVGAISLEGTYWGLSVD